MLKSSIILLFSFLVSSPLLFAQAQEHSGAESPLNLSDMQEYEDFVIPELGISIGRIENMAVIGQQGTQIGEAEEVLVDGSNRVVAITVEVGRFLGLVEHQVVVTLDQIGVQADREKLTATMTSEELEQLPEWND